KAVKGIVATIIDIDGSYHFIFYDGIGTRRGKFYIRGTHGATDIALIKIDIRWRIYIPNGNICQYQSASSPVPNNRGIGTLCQIGIQSLGGKTRTARNAEFISASRTSRKRALKFDTATNGPSRTT